MKISKKIIEIRNKNNLTQEDLADILFVSRQTISNWENDKCYPDIETLNIISNKFNIPLDVFLKEDEGLIKDISKKSKNNKISKIVIILLLIAIGIMIGLGYKMFLLCYYSNNFNTKIFDNYVSKIEKLNIESGTIKANEKFDNMNFYLPRKYYEESKGKYKSHLLYDTITIYKKDNLYNDLKTHEVFLKNVDYVSLFKKYNINNQIDLIKYIKNNYNNEINILTNKDKIQFKFILDYYVVNEVNNKDTILNYYYFEDNIVGKIIHRNCDYLIEIYNDNETYIIRVESAFMPKEDLLYILNSIYFD